MKLTISIDTRPLARALGDLGTRQIPFATASALTAAAKQAQQDVTAALPSIFDQPTPFTLRAIGTTSASKRDLTATVFVKDKQAQYLALEETGGTRLPANIAVVVPADIKLNRYGNMAKGAIKRLLQRPDTFSGTVHGIPGIWQRPPRGTRRGGGQGTKGALNSVQGFRTGLTLLVRYQSSTSYRPRFGFARRVQASVTASLPRLFAAALAKALATARR